MGFRDGAEDVRLFRTAILSGRVTPIKSLLTRAAMSEARTIADPAGNEKLSKSTTEGRRSRGRDDVAAAGIIAVAEGERGRSKSTAPRVLVAGPLGVLIDDGTGAKWHTPEQINSYEQLSA